MAAILSGCGEAEDQSEETVGSTAAASEEGLAPWCDGVPRIEAVRETHMSSLNPDDFVMGAVRRYTDEHADTFGGMWIDQMYGGTVVVAFTDDPAPHQTAIDALVPQPDDPIGIEPRPTIVPPTIPVGESEVAVDVVQVAHTERELDQVKENAMAVLADGDLQVVGVGAGYDRNRVALSFASDVTDEDRRLIAERLPVDQICLEGGPPVEPAADMPTSIIPAEGTDPWITCSGAIGGFHLSDLEHPPELRADHPLVRAIERDVPRWTSTMGAPTPTMPAGSGTDDPADEPAGADPTDWRIVVMSEDHALISLGSGDAAWALTAERQGDSWAITGGGSGPADRSPCTARAVLPEGLTEVAWGFDPAYPEPQPGDTILHLLVNNVACSSGRGVVDRIVEPEIVERAGQLLIGLAAESLGGGFQSCQGTMAEPYDLTLPEPLGTQVIADGTFLPPRPAEVSSGGF